MTTAVERLEALLNEKDEEIAVLKVALDKSARDLHAAEAGWSLPHGMETDDQTLPVPRLELAWTPSPTQGWRSYSVEYRLVMRIYWGDLVAVPLGLTEIDSSDGRCPFAREWPMLETLPLRDKFHALHDSAHLRLPLYALTDAGPVRVDALAEQDYAQVLITGEKHRRELEGSNGEK